MANKGTGLAVGLMVFEVALALLLLYIALVRTDIREHMLAAALAALLLMAVLMVQIFFFKYPENRRPIVFFLLFILLLMGPLIALMLVQAFTEIQMDFLIDPNPPFPWPLLPYILVISFIIIRTATWAMTFDPAPDAKPISQASLQQKLLSMKSVPELPFDVKPGKHADDVIVDWKYADAAWFDLMHVHKTAYLSRLVLHLDETDHTVRVRQYQSQLDASAGQGGLALAFKAQWGAISFYEFKHETVYGVQIKNGRPVAKLSYTYDFDIKEMRDPVQRLINESGWTFKCVMLPVRWLTG